MYCCLLQGQHKLAFVCCSFAVENDNYVIWSVTAIALFHSQWYTSFDRVLLDFCFLSLFFNLLANTLNPCCVDLNTSCCADQTPQDTLMGWMVPFARWEHFHSPYRLWVKLQVSIITIITVTLFCIMSMGSWPAVCLRAILPNKTRLCSVMQY